MARKRMFSLCVVDTDKFLDMPTSAQALYFHLGMHADDDGFVSSPRKIARSAGCNDTDLSELTEKGFIIPFKNGVVVITDWAINNTIKKDRYTPTIYKNEVERLKTDSSGRYYIEMETDCPTNGSRLEPEYSIDKIRIDKVSRDKGSIEEEGAGEEEPTCKNADMRFNDKRNAAISSLANYGK